jgi:hypothetical protein
MFAAEVSNLIGNRVKKPRLEGRSYVVPDSILVGNRDQNALESSLAEEEMVSSSAATGPPYCLHSPLTIDRRVHRREACRLPPTP